MPGEESTSGSPKPGYLIATEDGQAENQGGRLVAGTIARGGSSVEPAGFQGRDSLGIWNGRSSEAASPVIIPDTAPGELESPRIFTAGSGSSRRRTVSLGGLIADAQGLAALLDGAGRGKNPHQPHFFLAIAAKCTIRQIKKFRGAARAGPGRKGVVNCTHWADTCWSNSTVVTQNR